VKVIRAGVLGFCMGVRRAAELACAEAEKSGRVFTFGPLVHNPRVLETLKSRGVEIIDENRLPRNINGETFIIRAHGISPQAEAELRRRGGRIIDATCPKVKASQLKARALAAAGYGLFLAGEAGHAEIIGVRGYAASAGGVRTFCVVVGNAAEAEKAAAGLSVAGPFPAETGAKPALIGQTTISEEEYRAIGDAIKKYFSGLEIIETICAATRERQDALRELLDKVDAVIIAGGKESANTRRLLSIAREHGKPCALSESAADIPPGFAAFQTVGLCAGASTPDTVIDEIERALTAGPFGP
jgi:4-hydroxy-3-methylbut-2-enyl diphosphate reductase